MPGSVAFLAQLTDLHLRRDEHAENARDGLEAAVAALLELPRPPDAVVITGDLTDTGHPDEYAAVTAALAPLTVPVHVLPGNHDLPDTLAAAFPTPADVRVGTDLRMVLCDTTVAGEGGGHLDTDWLAALLDDDRETPTVVAMHHAPLTTGIPYLDRIGLAAGDRERLADVLRANRQVVRVICGHIHRVTYETLGGCGVCSAPSTEMQAEPAPDPSGLRFVKRGRGMMLHSFSAGGLVSHIQPI